MGKTKKIDRSPEFGHNCINMFVLILNFLIISVSSSGFSWINSEISLQWKSILKALISEEEKRLIKTLFMKGNDKIHRFFSLLLSCCSGFKFPVLQCFVTSFLDGSQYIVERCDSWAASAWQSLLHRCFKCKLGLKWLACILLAV